MITLDRFSSAQKIYIRELIGSHSIMREPELAGSHKKVRTATLVYTRVRAVFTTYLLTTCLWVDSREAGKKSN
jgi:hypothetical protein